MNYNLCFSEDKIPQIKILINVYSNIQISLTRKEIIIKCNLTQIA